MDLMTSNGCGKIFPRYRSKIYGKPLVYLDNAASAQKPNVVLERMTEAFKTEYANVRYVFARRYILLFFFFLLYNSSL